ncbi:MAG: hypothetical protein D3904_07595 [Candidatus Electrothrix sp. EH2]|nr:hypothetical protein [Candidatus Electrothrix sp. EH2]
MNPAEEVYSTIRLIASLQGQGGADLFVAALGKQAIEFASPFVHQLRKLGLQTAMDYSNRSLKAQMKQAGRLNAGLTLIVGEQELEQGKGILRNMNTQEQSEFSLHSAAEELAARLAESADYSGT